MEVKLHTLTGGFTAVQVSKTLALSKAQLAQREGQDAAPEFGPPTSFPLSLPSGAIRTPAAGRTGAVFGSSRRGGAGTAASSASCRLDADGLDVEFKSRKPDKASLGIPAGRTKQNGSVVRIDLHFIESAFRTSAPFVL